MAWAWRIIVQPNEEYALFQEGEFTHLGMTRDKAIKTCRTEFLIGAREAEDAANLAGRDPGRWLRELGPIGTIYGLQRRDLLERIGALPRGVLYGPTN